MKLHAPVSILIALLLSFQALCAPLSGNYTIGGNAPDYATFNAAVSALVSAGVSGPVTFNVRPGTYNEQISITAVTGTSGTNTVTFQSQTGNRTDVVLTYAATGTGNNWVVNLNGVSHIIFNEMTLQSTGVTFSNVVIMDNSASYNKLTNLIITAPVATTNNTNQILVNLTEDGSCTGYDAVYSSTLNNGSYGVYNSFGYSCGQSYNYGMVVENDSFNNQYAGAIYEVRCLTGASIEFNNITTNSTDTSYNAIFINIQEDTICCNKIINCPGTGINFANCSPFIFNNFVEIVGTAVNYGIEFDWDNYCADFVFVSANTVLVLNTNSQSSAFYLPYPGYSWNFPFNNLSDNVFINRGGGYAVNLTNNGSVSGTPYGQTIVVDYNDYYTTGAYIGVWGSTNCTTLANWQSTISGCNCGADAHSKNINPDFVSNTDLHLTADDLRYGTSANQASTTDIDGQLRNSGTRDMGADEYSISPATPQFTASSTNVCVGSQITFTDQSTGSPLSWKWSFTGGTPDTSSAQNPSVTYNQQGTYNVKLVIANSIGSDSLTKTAYITVMPLPVAGTVSTGSDTICAGGTAQLNVTGDTGNIQWQSSANGNSFTDILGAQSSTYNSSALTQTSYYRVKASGTCGIDSSNVKEIFVLAKPVAGTLSATPADTICSGGSVELSVTGDTGNIQWQFSLDGGDFIAIYNADSIVYFTLSQTNFFRLIAFNDFCSDTSQVIAVIVNPLPQVPVLSVNDSIICAADSAQIQVLGNYSSYVWNDGDTTNTNSVSSAQAYWVTITDANGCSAVSGHQNISVYPASSVSIAEHGDTLTSINSISYQWLSSDTVIPGATDSVYVVHETGDYAVQVIDTNGCNATSMYTHVVISGISSLSREGQLIAYPNPATDILTIQVNNFSPEMIFIYDVTGKLAIEEKFMQHINIGNLQPGLYFIEVKGEGVVGRRNFLKL